MDVTTALRTLGLDAATEWEQIRAAHRDAIVRTHPDRGGDQRRFMLLQKQYEEALTFLRELETDKSNATTASAE